MPKKEDYLNTEFDNSNNLRYWKALLMAAIWTVI